MPKFLAVDTEFLRERTYYPQLCLIQISDGVDAVAIDPLAPNLDLNPLWDLMRNQNITKVFHAGNQDMEIFLHLMGSPARSQSMTRRLRRWFAGLAIRLAMTSWSRPC
jgi:ribonuclease D